MHVREWEEAGTHKRIQGVFLGNDPSASCKNSSPMCSLCFTPHSICISCCGAAILAQLYFPISKYSCALLPALPVWEQPEARHGTDEYNTACKHPTWGACMLLLQAAAHTHTYTHTRRRCWINAVMTAEDRLVYSCDHPSIHPWLSDFVVLYLHFFWAVVNLRHPTKDALINCLPATRETEGGKRGADCELVGVCFGAYPYLIWCVSAFVCASENLCSVTPWRFQHSRAFPPSLPPSSLPAWGGQGSFISSSLHLG